jgi:hypothetical protein
MKPKHTHTWPRRGSLKFAFFQTGEQEQAMAIGWKILSKIIPYGRAEEVQDKMHVSLDTVHRWMRMPLSKENPHATGRANPIDQAIRLIEVAYEVNPEDAHEIVDAFVSKGAELEAKRVGPAMSVPEVEKMLRRRARELEAMANALAGKKQGGK